MQSIINPNFHYEYIPHLDWVAEECVNSNRLLIVVGDSWTWGATLCRPEFEDQINDREYRVKQIYGYHLHKRLNYDWVNLALCGTDNIEMINGCWNFLKTLEKSYEKIHIVITLTELGRELTGKNFLEQRQKYEQLQGSDWPAFDAIVNNSASKKQLDFVRQECFESNFEIIYAIELYLAIQNSKTVNELLENYEKYTFELIKRLLTGPNIVCTVARNYTDNCINNTQIEGLNFIDKKWTDVIAEQGQLTSYPTGIKFLGQLAIEPLLKFIEHKKINDKSGMVDLLDLASDGIDWLEQSQFNSHKKGYKHPKEIGHQWWADYLYENIKW